MTLALTPHYNLLLGGSMESKPEVIFDYCKEMGTTFCLPHQGITDALLDKRAGIVRDLDRHTCLIRERGMVPGVSTHAPETVIYAARQQADVKAYIQIYNAAGFHMPVEVEWAVHIIRHAQEPVLAIEPLTAACLGPAMGLTFVWKTLRDSNLVSVDTTTLKEAEEVISISLAYLARRAPEVQLQVTHSKKALVDSWHGTRRTHMSGRRHARVRILAENATRAMRSVL